MSWTLVLLTKMVKSQSCDLLRICCAACCTANRTNVQLVAQQIAAGLCCATNCATTRFAVGFTTTNPQQMEFVWNWAHNGLIHSADETAVQWLNKHRAWRYINNNCSVHFSPDSRAATIWTGLKPARKLSYFWQLEGSFARTICSWH